MRRVSLSKVIDEIKGHLLGPHGIRKGREGTSLIFFQSLQRFIGQFTERWLNSSTISGHVTKFSIFKGWTKKTWKTKWREAIPLTVR